jgi:hypothetical protein
MTRTLHELAGNDAPGCPARALLGTAQNHHVLGSSGRHVGDVQLREAIPVA